MPVKYTFGNHTDVGKVRSANEDYYGNWETPNGHLFVVCDGMGGHVGGAEASRIAVESIYNYFIGHKPENIVVALQKALEYANDCIIQKKSEQPELSQMGTTAVVLIVRDDKVYYAHVGDSRIYYYTQGKLKRITRDHSLVQSLIDSGNLTEEEAENHPRRNEIYRALGITQNLEATICDTPIEPSSGDYLLLCTDGLSGLVRDEAIRKIISSKDELQSKVVTLIGAALENGGTDNITAQLIAFKEEGSAAGKNKMLNWKIIVGIVAVVLFAASVVYHFSGQKSKPDTNDTSRKKFPVSANDGVPDSTKHKGTGITSNVPADEKRDTLEYVIKKKEDSNKLYAKFSMHWSEIKKMNPQYNSPIPKKDGRIKILVKAIKKVRQGVNVHQFISELSREYHVPTDKICETNGIDSDATEKTVNVIVIPISQ